MVPLFSNWMCFAKKIYIYIYVYILKSPFNFSLIDDTYILCLWKFLLFLTPVLWFPFLFCFYFVFPRQWSQGDRTLWRSVHKGGFVLCWQPFWGAMQAKINPTAIDVPPWYRLLWRVKWFSFIIFGKVFSFGFT